MNNFKDKTNIILDVESARDILTFKNKNFEIVYFSVLDFHGENGEIIDYEIIIMEIENEIYFRNRLQVDYNKCEEGFWQDKKEVEFERVFQYVKTSIAYGTEEELKEVKDLELKTIANKIIHEYERKENGE